MRPCTRSSNAVRPSGTRNRIARGAPAASRARDLVGGSARHVRSYVHDAAGRLGGLALRLQLLGPAVAVVRVARCDQPRRRGARYRSSRSVWKYGACGPPTPGPSSQSSPSQRHAVEDAGDHVGRRALDVGVFDAQDERAAVAAGVEPVEERGARAADVQIPGRRRRETDADGHRTILCRGQRPAGPAARTRLELPRHRPPRSRRSKPLPPCAPISDLRKRASPTRPGSTPTDVALEIGAPSGTASR